MAEPRGAGGGRGGAGVPESHAPPPAPGLPLRMRVPRPQPWGLCFLLFLLPGTLRAGEGRSATAVGGGGRRHRPGKERTKQNRSFPWSQAFPPPPHFFLSRCPPWPDVSGSLLPPQRQVSDPPLRVCLPISESCLSRGGARLPSAPFPVSPQTAVAPCCTTSPLCPPRPRGLLPSGCRAGWVHSST